MLVQTSPPPQILPGCWQLLMQRKMPEAETQLAPVTQSSGALQTSPTSILALDMSGMSAGASSTMSIADMSCGTPISLGVGSKTPHPVAQSASARSGAASDLIDVRRMNKSARVLV
jgi:hypothetical protein